MNSHKLRFVSLAFMTACMACTVASAQGKYGPGASDTEIKVGNVTAYTGVFAEYGQIARAEAAYFRMINDEGGINGRKINFVSVDSGSNVQTAVALAHKLVDEDQVLLLVSVFGAQSNLEIRPYMNEKHVPQLFVASNASTFDDPQHFPWTMGWEASRHTEAAAYAKYILRNKPDAKIGVLYGNDEAGHEYVTAIREALGEKAATMIVKEEAISYGDPTGIDAHVVALKDSGANVFLNMTFGRFATEAIREAYDIDWHPLQFIPNGSLSIAAFIEPAGLEKANGIITNARSKGWSDPRSRQDPDVRAFLAWMKQYNTEANERDANNVYGYEVAQTLVAVLKQCGNDLTRENVMKQAASLNLELGMLRPGIRISTSPTDYRPIKQLYLLRFNGQHWVPTGDVAGD
ncbi:ABC transporter substrate-binding protein [Trinickia acidisoli]|uniref:ABC transporter substrate-binding protein n=1 Tax=Trinickia acidisoli TaxID=2767482 RepID=UPI001A8CB999|nr:ABC transporter substrate-binding protein [Trinickia acidisoli]